MLFYKIDARGKGPAPENGETWRGRADRGKTLGCGFGLDGLRYRSSPVKAREDEIVFRSLGDDGRYRNPGRVDGLTGSIAGADGRPETGHLDTRSIPQF